MGLRLATERALHIASAINLNGLATLMLRATWDCCGAVAEPCEDCRELLRRAAQFQVRADQHAAALTRGL